MARDYISIGATPAEEPCEQLGPYYSPARARDENFRFIELIRKTVGNEPEGALLGSKAFDHEWGRYYEVVCYFDDDNEEAMQYAYKCEAEAPSRWQIPDEYTIKW